MYVNPIWSPMTHRVSFGPNLIVTIEAKKYYFSEEGTIDIRSDEKVLIESMFALSLPGTFGPLNSGNVTFVGGFYEILESCSFPGVTKVQFVEFDYLPKYTVMIGVGHIITLAPIANKEGYVFIGWATEEGIKISGQFIAQNKVYTLYAQWLAYS
jgi:uncharacterized repeat protein (TIGR02543 family)